MAFVRKVASDPDATDNMIATLTDSIAVACLKAKLARNLALVSNVLWMK